MCVKAMQVPAATPHECSTIQPGGIQIIIFNSDPINEIVLFPIQPIMEAVGSIFVTNKAWNSTDIVTDEGILEVRKKHIGLTEHNMLCFAFE
jgi:hypothetical protein